MVSELFEHFSTNLGEAGLATVLSYGPLSGDYRTRTHRVKGRLGAGHGPQDATSRRGPSRSRGRSLVSNRSKSGPPWVVCRRGGGHGVILDASGLVLKIEPELKAGVFRTARETRQSASRFMRETMEARLLAAVQRRLDTDDSESGPCPFLPSCGSRGRSMVGEIAAIITVGVVFAGLNLAIFR